MLLSMTGYGKAHIRLGDKSYTIEIKSLNSKQLDLNFKMVAELRDQELEIRKKLAAALIRGKVDVFFQEDKANGMSANLNLALVEQYYLQLQQFSSEKNIPLGDILPAILRFQDVNKNELSELKENDVKALFEGIATAIQQLIQFRTEEGRQLEKDLMDHLQQIQTLKKQLEPFEQNRIVKLKEKMRQELNNWLHEEHVDKNRFEEEIIYYLEKMDINEEKVRLDAHCAYFMQVLNEKEVEKGKKLGFIAQEIGREINTIGSKASDASMQQIVVQMKDELEKIKEQVLNAI